jgi:hypothetical protein
VSDTRLSPNVALLDHNQTFTGANTFSGQNIFTASNSFTGPNAFSGTVNHTGVNTFNNNGNSIIGSFFGNGLVGWLPLAAAVTATNATRDNGYMLLGTALTTVTLPASASLTPVDIIRVSGAGTGGWKVKANAGQSIIGTFACYSNSFVAQLPSVVNDHGVAASADGIRVYAVDSDASHGVLVDSDSGHNFVRLSSLNGAYVSIACSANGKVVYAEPASGTIAKSTDYGASWSTAGQPAANGTAISCTADGATLYMNNIASSGNGAYRGQISGGSIQLSINSGGFATITGPGGTVSCLAVSSDCTKILAGVTNGFLYASSNQGATWTVVVPVNKKWVGAWMSPDGSKFAAAAIESVFNTGDGAIYSGNIIPLANTVSSGNTISGSQGSAVELQYTGNNTFIPVSSSGLIWAN